MEWNGDVETCVKNLLQMERGEVPLDQLRGIRADLIDKPAAAVEPFYRANVIWVIENYEPRAEAGEIAIQSFDNNGNFITTTKVQGGNQ